MFRIAALLALLALSACAADPCRNAANPGECRAWGDAGGDIEDYLIGGMAGYMLANRGGSTVIVRDERYLGPPRTLRPALPSERRQINALRAKVERQRIELKRQQAANAAQRRSSTSSRSWSSPSRSFGSGSRTGRR